MRHFSIHKPTQRVTILQNTISIFFKFLCTLLFNVYTAQVYLTLFCNGSLLCIHTLILMTTVRSLLFPRTYPDVRRLISSRDPIWYSVFKYSGIVCWHLIFHNVGIFLLIAQIIQNIRRNTLKFSDRQFWNFLRSWKRSNFFGSFKTDNQRIST